MKILVIVEDPTLDQYIVKPVVERIFHDLHRRAAVQVLQDPHLRGSDDALDSKTLGEIIQDHRMIDLFILIVDRDCDRKRNRSRHAARLAEHPRVLVGCLAVEEVEVWMLALHHRRRDGPFADIRAECDPKERFAEPFLRNRGWAMDVGRGRKRAMDALRTRWHSLVSRCPEVAALDESIRLRVKALGEQTAAAPGC